MINFFIKNQHCYDYTADQISTSVITYSHLPTAIIAALFGSYVLYKSRSLNTFILFLICIFYFIWSFLDLVTWIPWFNFTGPSSVMFSWASLEIFGLLIFLFSFYFLYVSTKEKDIPFYYKILGIMSLFPLVYWEITGKILTKYDTFFCEVVENNLVTTYITVIESVVILAVTLFTIFELNEIKEDSEKRKKIIFSGLSVFLFLIVFSLSGSLADLLNNLGWKDAYNFGVYSLFGMPIFIGFLGYLIVRFKTFSIRLFGAQALVLGLITLVGSKLFTAEVGANRSITLFTLVTICFFGYFLIKSVKKEIETRERIQRLADELEIASHTLHEANEGQKNLIHIMNHQIKGYLAVGRNIFAELATGDYGKVTEEAKPLLTKGFDEMTDGVEYVQSVLRGESAKSGTLPFDMKPMDLKPVIEGLISKQKDVAEKKGLSFESTVADGKYTIIGDTLQLDEAFKNLFTNAIKYNTPNGSIKVTLSETDGKILFTIKDTGIGISEEDQKNLFKPGGMGKNSIKYNTDAAGYGLAFVKPVIETHKGGKIWYETEVGKGTTFFVELPVEPVHV